MLTVRCIQWPLLVASANNCADRTALSAPPGPDRNREGTSIMAKLKYADFSDERKARERERARQWRANNPELAKEHDRRKSVKLSAERHAFRLLHPLVRLTKEERKARSRASCKKWHADNRDYANGKYAERYAANPEKRKAATRNSVYKRKYGLTIAEYDAMVAAQGGRCAICEADRPGGMGRWPIDHCAKTGKVRRLLCNACNPGLGFFKHDIALLQRAINYLKAFESV
jgi:hypothetical protein